MNLFPQQQISGSSSASVGSLVNEPSITISTANIASLDFVPLVVTFYDPVTENTSSLDSVPLLTNNEQTITMATITSCVLDCKHYIPFSFIS